MCCPIDRSIHYLILFIYLLLKTISNQTIKYKFRQIIIINAKPYLVLFICLLDRFDTTFGIYPHLIEFVTIDLKVCDLHINHSIESDSKLTTTTITTIKICFSGSLPAYFYVIAADENCMCSNFFFLPRKIK